MGINDDMDRYLKERKRAKAFSFIDRQPWWSRMFGPKDTHEDFPPDEEAKLETMEKEIKKGHEELKMAQTPIEEEKLEYEQEERVSLYQRLRNLFQKERKLEDAYEHVEMMEEHAAPDQSVTDDFRELAQIQMRWLSRMPTRVKEEFKESPDYAKYKEILTRRGVAKAKE